jgi:hypothetical protein
MACADEPGRSCGGGRRAPLTPESAAAKIAELRALAGWTPRDFSIGSFIDQTQRRVTRARAQLGTLIELWRNVLPAELADRTSLTSLRSGMLQVTVDSASVRYELDRVLREGALETLRRSYGGTLTRVKITVALEDPEGGRRGG